MRGVENALSQADESPTVWRVAGGPRGSHYRTCDEETKTLRQRNSPGDLMDHPAACGRSGSRRRPQGSKKT